MVPSKREAPAFGDGPKPLHIQQHCHLATGSTPPHRDQKHGFYSACIVPSPQLDVRTGDRRRLSPRWTAQENGPNCPNGNDPPPKGPIVWNHTYNGGCQTLSIFVEPRGRKVTTAIPFRSPQKPLQSLCKGTPGNHAEAMRKLNEAQKLHSKCVPSEPCGKMYPLPLKQPNRRMLCLRFPCVPRRGGVLS